MNIRKLIREILEGVISEVRPGVSVPGIEILNHYPFNKLPNSRSEVDWNNRDVKGWGPVSIPSVNAGSLSTMFGKDDVVEYIEDFKNRYNEEPVFVLHPTAPWYGKVEILNKVYQDSKTLYDKAVQSFGTEGD